MLIGADYHRIVDHQQPSRSPSATLTSAVSLLLLIAFGFQLAPIFRHQTTSSDRLDRCARIARSFLASCSVNAYWVTAVAAGSTWSSSSSSSSSSSNLSPANDSGVLSTPGGWYAGAAAPASAFPPPGSTRPPGRPSLSRNHVLPWVWFQIVGASSLSRVRCARFPLLVLPPRLLAPF